MPEKPLEFVKDVKEMYKSKSYIFLTISYTFLYGIYTSLGGVVSQMTSPYGYSPVDNAIFGATFILCGVIGSFVFGFLIDKTSKYQTILRVVIIIGVVSIPFTFFTLPSGNGFLFAFNLVFLGIAVIPIIPIAYSYSVELTYPVSEAMSNGMMIMFSQIYGTLLVSL